MSWNPSAELESETDEVITLVRLNLAEINSAIDSLHTNAVAETEAQSPEERYRQPMMGDLWNGYCVGRLDEIYKIRILPGDTVKTTTKYVTKT